MSEQERAATTPTPPTLPAAPAAPAAPATRTRRPKGQGLKRPPSRASRAATAARQLGDAAERMREIQNKVLELKERFEEELSAVLGELDASAIEDAQGEVDALAEEMRSWFDNAPENLQNGERLQVVSGTADALEGMADIASELDAGEKDASELLEALGEFADALGEDADTLESKASELEGLEFPTMFG